jgi:hypothetical protein
LSLGEITISQGKEMDLIDWELLLNKKRYSATQMSVWERAKAFSTGREGMVGKVCFWLCFLYYAWKRVGIRM